MKGKTIGGAQRATANVPMGKRHRWYLWSDVGTFLRVVQSLWKWKENHGGYDRGEDFGKFLLETFIDVAWKHLRFSGH